jgi:hypothetical protein
MEPEIALWRAVIAQAVLDATSVIRPRVEGRRVSPASRENAVMYAAKRLRAADLVRQRARLWLLGNSRDFNEVCALAMLDADAVREHAETMAIGGWSVGQTERLADALAVEDAA